MPKKKGVAVTAAPKERASGVEAQINALEQERLRSSVSERLVRSLADLKQELAAVTERNRRRIERLKDQAQAVAEPEQVATLCTLHADLERLLAAYWFFLTAESFPSLTGPPSVRDPASVTEALEPFSELLFG